MSISKMSSMSRLSYCRSMRSATSAMLSISSALARSQVSRADSTSSADITSMLCATSSKLGLATIGDRAGRSCTSPSFARIRIASRRGVRLTPSSAAWSRSLTAVPGGSTPRRMSRRSRVAICSGRVSSVMAQFTSLNPHLFSTRKGGLP